MNLMPSGWVECSLAEVCEPVEKIDPMGAGRSEIRYVDIGSIDGATQRLVNSPVISAASAPTRARQVLRSADTVFSTVRPYLRKIAYIDDSLNNEFASTGFTVLRPGSRLLPRYLFHFATSESLLSQVLPHQRGVSYPAVRDKDVLASRIPVPPLDEQRRIVDILEDHLSRLDAAAALLSRVDGGLTALINAWLAHLPWGKNVEARPLGDVLVGSRTGWSRGRRHEAPSDQGVPYLKMNNIRQDGELVLDRVTYVTGSPAEIDRFTLRAGDLLFNSKNSRELVGKTTVVDERSEGFTFNENLARLRFADSVVPEFAALQFNSPMFRDRLRGEIKETTNVAAIYLGSIRRLPFAVPSVQVQHSMVKQYRELLETVTRLRSEAVGAAERTDRLKRSLLRTAFSGGLSCTGRERGR